MASLANKVVVVTGGSTGIGFGIAEQCAKEGAKIILAAQNVDKLEKAVKQLEPTGAEVSFQKVNVAEADDWAALVKSVMEKYGRIDYLFSNAGISFNKTLLTVKPEEWEWIFNVNFWSHVKGIHAVLPVMMAQEDGGHIVFTTSFASFAAPATMVPYACTKSASLSLAEGLRNEMELLQMDKIKVSVVMPAYVATNIQHNEASRPDYCKDVESNANDIDKFVWQKIATDLSEGVGGTVSVQTAGERIIDQVKRGYFYIYTHRNFAKACLADKTYRMLMDKPQFDPSTFMSEYYARKQVK